MANPKIDMVAGKVTFPEGEAVSTPSDMAYVAIPKATMSKLSKLAIKDGFKPNAGTDKGVAIQLSKAGRTYVLMAIDMLLAKRGA